MASERNVQQLGPMAGPLTGYGAGPHFDCDAIADEVFGELAVKPALSHVAYLFRRFGPPFWGGDPHKEIAQWILTTGKPNLFFWVSCKATALRGCFGVLMGPGLERRFGRQLHGEPPNRLLAECREELLACFRDLLRPVFVRDVPINLLGRCEDTPAAYENRVQRSRYAGYGCDRGALDATIAAEGSNTETPA